MNQLALKFSNIKRCLYFAMSAVREPIQTDQSDFQCTIYVYSVCLLPLV